MTFARRRATAGRTRGGAGPKLNCRKGTGRAANRVCDRAPLTRSQTVEREHGTVGSHPTEQHNRREHHRPPTSPTTRREEDRGGRREHRAKWGDIMGTTRRPTGATVVAKKKTNQGEGQGEFPGGHVRPVEENAGAPGTVAC